MERWLRPVGVLATCAAAWLPAACAPSGPVAHGPAVTWKGGAVQTWDYGAPNVNSRRQVEWVGAGNRRRTLCETGVESADLSVDGEGRLVVRFPEPGTAGTIEKTLIFKSLDEAPAESRKRR
jgi:hypothetical protein